LDLRLSAQMTFVGIFAPMYHLDRLVNGRVVFSRIIFRTPKRKERELFRVREDVFGKVDPAIDEAYLHALPGYDLYIDACRQYQCIYYVYKEIAPDSPEWKERAGRRRRTDKVKSEYRQTPPPAPSGYIFVVDPWHECVGCGREVYGTYFFCPRCTHGLCRELGINPSKSSTWPEAIRESRNAEDKGRRDHKSAREEQAFVIDYPEGTAPTFVRGEEGYMRRAPYAPGTPVRYSATEHALGDNGHTTASAPVKPLTWEGELAAHRARRAAIRGQSQLAQILRKPASPEHRDDTWHPDKRWNAWHYMQDHRFRNERYSDWQCARLKRSKPLLEKYQACGDLLEKYQLGYGVEPDQDTFNAPDFLSYDDWMTGQEQRADIEEGRRGLQMEDADDPTTSLIDEVTPHEWEDYEPDTAREASAAADDAPVWAPPDEALAPSWEQYMAARGYICEEDAWCAILLEAGAEPWQCQDLIVNRDGRTRRLLRVLHKLRPEERAVLIQKLFWYTQAEIAEAVGLRQQRVSEILQRLWAETLPAALAIR
jgi:DNA-directed RNA polymerase specialized sigma24 family protein